MQAAGAFFILTPLGVKVERIKRMTKQEEQNLENAVKEEKPEEIVQPAAEPQKTEEHMIPKGRLDEEIQKRKDLEKRLAAIEKANQEAETKRLKESEDYKALYEKTQAELSEVKPRAEKAESMEQALKEDLEAQIAAIPEDRRTLIPTELPVDAQLKWISRNRPLLSKAAPFDIGAGKQGGEGKSVELTAEQREIAQKLGLKPEDYAKNLK